MNSKKEKSESDLQEQPNQLEEAIGEVETIQAGEELSPEEKATLHDHLHDTYKKTRKRNPYLQPVLESEEIATAVAETFKGMKLEPVRQFTKQLDAALLEAQRLVQVLPKDSRNNYSKYDYTSAEAVIIESRRCLNEAGLVLVRNNWKIGEPFESDAKVRIIVHEFRLSHPDSGESRDYSVPFPSHEKNGTPLDKAVSGSLTSCLSYFLRDLLLIPRSDNDINTRDDTDHKPSGKFSGRSGGDDRRPHKPRHKQDRSSQGKDLAGAATPPPEQFGPNWKALEGVLRDGILVTNKKQAEDVIRWITLGKHEDLEKVKRDENLCGVITGCLKAKQESGVKFASMIETAANYTPEQEEEKSVEEEQ